MLVLAFTWRRMLVMMKAPDSSGGSARRTENYHRTMTKMARLKDLPFVLERVLLIDRYSLICQQAEPNIFRGKVCQILFSMNPYRLT